MTVTTARTTLLVIEDESIVRSGLELWLRNQDALALVGSAETARTGEELCLDLKPEVVLLDIGLPDGDGLQLATRLRAALPHLRVLVLSGRSDGHTIWRVLNCGVQGFVGKSEQPLVLQQALLALARGETFFSPLFAKVRQRLLREDMSFTKILTRRQNQVLQLLAGGRSDAEIAQVLKIAEPTVAVHRKNLRAKLGVHDDRGLIKYAREWGLV